MKTFQNLVEMLPAPSKLPVLRNNDSAIEQPAATPEGFLPPKLSEDTAEGHDHPRVLLLRAPAAVGKSWLARALSARSGNPLWDLSRFRLGSNFFTGTIATNYGGAGYALIEEEIARGGLCFILDAADEAMVGAGISNYEAAIRDLSTLIADAPDGVVSSVILGRPETLELTATMLEEHSITWKMYNVAYFDQEESAKFVALKVAGSDQRVVDADVRAFVDEFRNSVSDALASDGRSPEDFLGYAPVLDALANFYIRHDNPHAMLAEIRQDRTDDYAWTLLVQIVDAICDREQQKLVNIVGGRESQIGRAAEVSYTKDEQVRLLLLEEADSAELSVPASLSSADQLELVESWRTQFAEHPFRSRSASRAGESNPLAKFSSVIFRDYCAAHGLLSSDEFAALSLADHLSAPTIQASPMLVRLMSKVLSESSPDRSPLVSDALGVLLDSVQAARGRLRAFVLETTGDESSIPEKVSLEIFDGKHPVVSVEVQVDISTVDLGRSIGHTVIDTPSLDVRIDGVSRDFLFDEATEVSARSLLLRAEDVRIVAGSSKPVEIQVQRFASSTARVFAPDEAGLVLQSTQPVFYPWHAFAGSVGHSDADDSDGSRVREAGRDLRRLVTWFSRPSMTGRFTYPITPMDIILRKGRADQKLFDYCVDQGYITRDDNSYRFSEPAPVMAIMGVELEDVHLRDFLRGYLRSLDSKP